jgi:hypothetical protein
MDLDFQDRLLAGAGVAGGAVLGSRFIAPYVSNRWGREDYYKSQANGLGSQSDLEYKHQESLRDILQSDLSEQEKARKIKILQMYRQKELGQTLVNTERSAERNQRWGNAKGAVAGTLGTAAVGGALGLGYGLSNDFGTSKKCFANFDAYLPEEKEEQPKKRSIRKAAAIAVGSGAGVALGADVLNKFSNTGEGQYYAKEAAENFENLKGSVGKGLIKAGEHLQGYNFPEGLRYRPYNLDDWGHHSFSKAEKTAKFTRKHNSTYVQFKKAYNQAVANFIDPSAIASEGIGDYLGLGLGSLAGAEIGRAGSAQIKAKALRRSADPNERHNQILAQQLEAAQQIQDPVQRARAIEKAQSQADYESAKLQRWAGLKGGLLQAGYTGLGATTGLLGNTIAHHWDN